MSQIRDSQENERPPDKVIVWEMTMSTLPDLGGAGGFITAKDFKGKSKMTVAISEAPRIVPSQFKNAKGETVKRCRVTLKLPNGESRAWTMNNTTYSRLKAKFGASANKWLGKKVALEILPQIVRGEKRLVIYGEPS